MFNLSLRAYHCRWNLRCLIVLSIAVALAACMAAQLSRPSTKSPRVVLWYGYEGATVADSRDSRRATYAFATMAGKPIFPPFSFGKGFVGWWSARDNAIGLLRLTGSVKWISVPGGLPGKWGVYEIQFSPAEAILNVSRTRPEGGYPERGAFSVNLTTHKLSFLPGALAVHCSPGSERLAIQRGSQDIDIVESGKTLRAIHSDRKIWDWDLSTVGETVGILDEGGVLSIVGPKTVKRWKAGLMFRGSRVSMANAPDYVWMSGDLPFSLGSYLDAFSTDGRHVGQRTKSRFPFYRPIVSPDTEMLNLLKRSDERVRKRSVSAAFTARNLPTPKQDSITLG